MSDNCGIPLAQKGAKLAAVTCHSAVAPGTENDDQLVTTKGSGIANLEQYVAAYAVSKVFT